MGSAAGAANSSRNNRCFHRANRMEEVSRIASLIGQLGTGRRPANDTYDHLTDHLRRRTQVPTTRTVLTGVAHCTKRTKCTSFNVPTEVAEFDISDTLLYYRRHEVAR